MIDNVKMSATMPTHRARMIDMFRTMCWHGRRAKMNESGNIIVNVERYIHVS